MHKFSTRYIGALSIAASLMTPIFGTMAVSAQEIDLKQRNNTIDVSGNLNAGASSIGGEGNQTNAGVLVAQVNAERAGDVSIEQSGNEINIGGTANLVASSMGGENNQTSAALISASVK